MNDLAQKSVAVERLRPECIECVLEKYLKACPEDLSPSRKVDYLQMVFSMLADVPRTSAIPVIVRDIDMARRELFGEEDDYTRIKWHFNQILLDQIDSLRKRIHEAQDPLKLSMQLALVGNYIDFGAVEHVDESFLEKMIAEAETVAFDPDTFERLKAEMAEGGKLVFFTDNCGEVVMDRLFIEEIQKSYPGLEIAVILRGGDAGNDATMDDALQVGLDRIAQVEDNGNNIMGTWFPEVSPKAIQLVKDADFMIAKGQANFETLRFCGLNVYYLFLCKCDMFARMFSVEPFTGMLIHEDDVRNRDE